MPRRTPVIAIAAVVPAAGFNEAGAKCPGERWGGMKVGGIWKVGLQ